jgi:hypothetical protein
LLEYLGGQNIARSRSANRGASKERFDARLFAKELEAANLRNHVQRLKKCIEHAGLPPETEDTRNEKGIDSDYKRFVDTAMALNAVLERFREIVVLDVSRGTIEDLAAPPSRRTIVGPKRLAGFVTWLQQQTERSNLDGAQ